VADNWGALRLDYLSEARVGAREGGTVMETIFGYNTAFVEALLAVVFGVLILIAPKILNYLVAVYLIIIGVIGLWPHIAAMTTPATGG